VRHVSDEWLRIDMPRRGSVALDLEVGDGVTLLVQLHGRLYTLVSSVIELQPDGDALLIAPPRAAEQSEQRQFYRLITNIRPRRVSRVTSEGEELQLLAATIMDLSGGGVQLQMQEWVPVGAHLRIEFPLEGDPLDIVVDCLAVGVLRPDSRRSFYRVNARYVNIDRDTQERIIRFIFREQLALRQKGVL
jgi:c-di-GMP-binding flagellar brake protein YcgR